MLIDCSLNLTAGARIDLLKMTAAYDVLLEMGTFNADYQFSARVQVCGKVKIEVSVSFLPLDPSFYASKAY